MNTSTNTKNLYSITDPIGYHMDIPVTPTDDFTYFTLEDISSH
ncbi:hypothetical protein [Candidatus Nitrosacidococcus sp. I8]|nr:hypothetical protein [Candidatus Nitrosacidococcus sp. I8]CAH9018028.1 hypothetical protein NURINAE_00686 [Candidatus Nitrosacidococcus sp. I8]